MANLKATLIFDAAQFANDAKKAVASLNAQFSKVQFDGKKIAAEVEKVAKNIKIPPIKPVLLLPEGSIAKLRADLKELTAKRSIAIGIERTGFNADIESAKKKIRELEREGTEAGKKAGGFFAGNFRGNIQALGVAGLAAGAFSFAKGGLDSFKDGEVVAGKLANALKLAGLESDSFKAKLKEQENALVKNTLFTDDQVQAVQAIGIQTGLAGDELDNFVKGSLNVATEKGKDSAKVARALSESYKSGKEAFDETGESLGKVGDAFKRTEGLAAAAAAKNPAAQFQKILGELQETFGGLIAQILGGLVPVITTLSDILTPIVESLMPVLKEIFASLTPILEKVGAVLGDAVLKVFKALAPVIPIVVEAVSALLDALLPLLPPILELATSALPVLIAPIKILSAVIKFLADNILKPLVVFLGSVIEKFIEIRQVIVDKVLGAFEAIGGIISKVFGIDVGAAKKQAEQAGNVVVKEAENTVNRLAVLNKKPKVAGAAKTKEEKVGAFAGPSLADLQAGQFKLDEARKKSAEEIARFLEDLRLTEDEKELRDAKELFDQKIALAVELGQSTVELEQRKKKAIDAIEAKQLKEEKDRANDRLNIKKAAALAELDIYKRIADQTAGLAAEGTAVAKIAGIASVGISTYVAAAAALTLPPTGAGPILGIPLAAGIIIDGLLTASKIAGIPAFHEGTDYFTPPNGAREGFALLERGERVVSAKDNASGGNGGDLVKEVRALREQLANGITTNGNLRVETIARTRTEGTALVSAIKKVQYQRSLGVLG